MIGGIYPGQVAPGAGPPPAGSRAVSAGQTVPALGTTYFGQVGGLPTRGYRVLSQSQSLTRGALLTRRVAPTQSQSLVLARPGSVLHTVTASATIGGSRGIARRFSATQSQAPALVRTVARSQALAGSQAVAVVGQVRRALALTQSQAARLAAATARIVARTQSEALTLTRAAARGVSPIQGAAAGTRRLIARTTAVTQAEQVSLGLPPASTTLSLAQAGSVALAGRALAGSVTAAQAMATFVRIGASRALTAAHSASAALVRGVARVHALAQSSGLTTLQARVRPLAVTQTQAAGLRGALTGTRTGSQGASAGCTRTVAGSRSVGQTQSAVVARVVSPPHLMTFTQAQVQTTLLGRRGGSVLSASQTQDLQARVQARRAIASAQASASGLGRRDGSHQVRVVQSQTLARPLLLVRRTIMGQPALVVVYAVRGEGQILATDQAQTVGLAAASSSKLLSIAQSSSLGLRRPVVQTWTLTQRQVVVRVPRLKKGRLSVEVLGSTVLSMAVVASVRGEASAGGSILDETARPELLATAVSSDLRSEEA